MYTSRQGPANDSIKRVRTVLELSVLQGEEDNLLYLWHCRHFMGCKCGVQFCHACPSWHHWYNDCIIKKLCDR